MAKNIDEFITKVTLNAEEAKKQLDVMSKKVEEFRKLRDSAAKEGNGEMAAKYAKEIAVLEKQMRSYKAASQNVAHTLNNLTGATLAELKKAQKELNKEMQNVPRNTEYYKQLHAMLEQVKTEMKGVKEETAAATEGGSKLVRFLGSTMSNYTALILHDIQDAAMNFIGSVKDMVVESTELAKSAEGIRMAFDRINQPGLLDNLRKATHGTVTDLELMKQAVKFKDFNLPVEQLGTYLAFAQQKAKDTGESIDYLVNSIVTGLGRQSPQILDNLGLSAKEIREEAKRTGDFFGAVASIVEKNMSQAGEYVETTAERIQKATVRLKNEQERLGESLLPLRERAEEAYGTLQLKALQAVKFVFENRAAIIELLKTTARWAIEAAAITAVWNAQTIATKAHSAALAVNTALHRGWSVVAGTTKTVMTALALTWTLVTKGVKEFRIQLELAKAASLANPWAALATVLLTVGVAVAELIMHLKNEAKAAEEAKRATSEFVVMQKTMNEVNKEANRTVAQEKTSFEQLRKTLMDATKPYKERKAALDEIKRVCPEYHGQLRTENVLVNNNATALDNYVTNLVKAARAQAAFNKMVAVQENSMGHEQQLNARRGNRQWAINQLRAMGADENSSTVYLEGAGWSLRNGDGKVVKYDIGREEAMRIRRLVELVKWNDKRISQEQTILGLNKKQTDALDKMVNENGGYTPASSATPTTPDPTPPKGGGGGKGGKSGKSDADRLKEEKRVRKEAEDAAKAESDAKIAIKTHEYAMGKIAYREYIQAIASLQKEGLEKRRDVYVKGSAEYEKLNRELEELSFKGSQDVNRMKLEDLQRCKQREQATIEAQAAREEITEAEKQERLRLLEETFLADKVELYKEGSKERIDAEWELEQAEQKNKREREKQYLQQVAEIRQQYLRAGADLQKDIELKALKELYDKKLIQEEEYQEVRLAIEAKYARNPANDTKDKFNSRVSNGLAVAREKAGDANQSNPWTGDLQNYQSVNAQLKELYENDELTHAEYLAAKAENLSYFLESVKEKYGAVFEQVTAVYNGINSYAKACSDYEVAMVEKNYDKQIEAAGKNEKKRKKLEERKQKEIAAIKSKANKRAMKIEIAQALASTAMAAINAYSSAAEVPLIGYILAPVAAAAATAAGLLQVATIKKQHQTEEAGYYEGGFTGGKRFWREAGVVHEGEFVANHRAVSNPAILPFLNFLDQAQRNNTVGSLTAEDVTRSLGAGGMSQVVAPVVNVQTDNEKLRATLEQMLETQERLAVQLEQGIGVDVPIDGENGIYRRMKRYESLMKNK